MIILIFYAIGKPFENGNNLLGVNVDGNKTDIVDDTGEGCHCGTFCKDSFVDRLLDLGSEKEVNE
jgi:hypothetical protein